MMRGGWAQLRAITCVLGLGLCIFVAGNGCGGDDNGTTVTPMATPTATPLPGIAGEENLFGSTAQNSGVLTIAAVPLVPVYFSACLGGSGMSCAGGSLVYIGTDPGFKEADSSEATATLFALPDGITVGLKAISIDPALSLRFDTGTLSVAGQSLMLGTTPGIHADLEWQLVLAAGASFAAVHPVRLQLTTTSGAFTDSIEFTVNVQPSSGSPRSES